MESLTIYLHIISLIDSSLQQIYVEIAIKSLGLAAVFYLKEPTHKFLAHLSLCVSPNSNLSLLLCLVLL